MNAQQRHLRTGFSLIEIMIVITIMALVIGVAVPALIGRLNKAKITTARTTLHTLEQAISMYYTDTGRYPATLRDLVKKPKEESIAKKWQEGGYLKKTELPDDPWDNKYQYKLTPQAQHPYELYSYGSGGKG